MVVVVGDGDMAMDMARLEQSPAQALSHPSSPASHCLRASQVEPTVDAQTAVCVEVQDESSHGASNGGEFAECLDFGNPGDCGDVVGLGACLDFDKLGDCGESGISGEGGDGETGGGGESGKRSLENLELRELREFLGGANEGNSVEEVGEEEALLLAEAAKTGDGVSGSDSGECSSGDRKENHVTTAKSGNGKSAGGGGSGVATGATTVTKKKAKVDWTPELHRRFVHAVEQLGVEKAFPSRILELMGVQCLTRHNIASHLQKYRSHRRHLAAREAEAASWTHRRAYTHTPWARTSRRDGLPYLVPLHTPHIQPRPAVMSPLQQPAAGQPLQPPLKVWGYPTVDHSNVHMWQQPQVAQPPFWQAPDGTYWQHPATTFTTPYAHPMRVAPPLASPYPTPGFPDDTLSYYSDFDSMYLCNPPFDSDIGRAAGVAACSKPPETHLSKEVLDAAIGEALANPWTPPPLGLKPPSMEGVIAELQRQGINTVPPSTC